MKILMMMLAFASLPCLAKSEITELDVAQPGQSHYELVSVYDRPVLVIATVEVTQRVYVLKYYLDEGDCVALSITVNSFVWDAERQDWARDASGARACTVKRMLLYPHEKHRFKEAQQLLDSRIEDEFTYFKNHIQPLIPR